MKKVLVILAVAASFAGPVAAGVVYEIEVKDHEQSPPKTESIEAAVEGRSLKMGIASGGRGAQGDMIFRGDRREMVVTDHQDQSYRVIDQESLGQIAGQVNQAMAQMQEALENMPEDQRALIEEAMRDRMPTPSATPSRPESELRRTDERSTQSGYPCVKYEVLQDGQKIRELWVTDWENVEGGDKVVDVFEDLAEFFDEMLDSMPGFGQNGAGGDPLFEHMKELGGFPVVTREFDENGDLEGTSTLRSARRQTIDPAEFEPPAGYKRQEMFDGS